MTMLDFSRMFRSRGGTIFVSKMTLRQIGLVVVLCGSVSACGGGSKGAAEPTNKGDATKDDGGDPSANDKGSNADANGASDRPDAPIDLTDPDEFRDGDGGGDGKAGDGGGEQANKDAAPAGPQSPDEKALASIDRVKLSEFLVKPAAEAIKERQWARAIAIYQGLVVARGTGSPESRELGRAWTLAGQPAEAIKVLEIFVRDSKDAKAIAEARSEIARLRGEPANPFMQRFEVASSAKEGGEAFKRGRAAFKKKAYGEALFHFLIGYAVAPELPGFLRELGATYDKLGAKGKKVEFYTAYLQRRPFGKNADEVRAELTKIKGVLGDLIISSSLPCDEIWVNRQLLVQKGNKKQLTLKLAPGTYTALCYAPRYDLAIVADSTVAAGKKADLLFRWAVIVNGLENPYGRIAIEHPDPKRKGVLMDLGIANPEVGVVIPEDGRALRVVLKDDLGTKSVERFIKFKPGQREVVKW